MDVTGLVALESALARLKQQGVFCIIAGLRPQPESVLRKANVDLGHREIVRRGARVDRARQGATACPSPSRNRQMSRS